MNGMNEWCGQKRLAEMEEKYKKHAIYQTQFENENRTLLYEVDALKDLIEEQDELIVELRRQFKEKARVSSHRFHIESNRIESTFVYFVSCHVVCTGARSAEARQQGPADGLRPPQRDTQAARLAHTRERPRPLHGQREDAHRWRWRRRRADQVGAAGGAGHARDGQAARHARRGHHRRQAAQGAARQARARRRERAPPVGARRRAREERPAREEARHQRQQDTKHPGELTRPTRNAT